MMFIYCCETGNGLVLFSMRNRVTNVVLLKQMHLMKSDIQVQMQFMKNDLQVQIQSMRVQIAVLDERTSKGFEEARQHRQALQEDLEATMRMLYKHDKKLARL